MSAALQNKSNVLADIHASTTILHEWSESVIGQIPTMPDAKILDIARDAQNLERAAFMVRGACAAEMKKRIRERTRLRPELTGQEEQTIGKELSRLAHDIGVSPKTLDDDARIFETFQSDFRGDTETLDREHYRLALAAPDPKAAIDLAVEQKSKGTYTTRDFREDLKDLQGGVTTEKVAEKRWLHAPLTVEAGMALDTLCAHRNKSVSDLINQVLCDALYWHEQKGKR